MSSPSSQLTWKLWEQEDVEALHPTEVSPLSQVTLRAPPCPSVSGVPQGPSPSRSGWSHGC